MSPDGGSVPARPGPITNPIELLDINATLGRFPRAATGPGTPADLLPGMDRVGIAGAVVSDILAWLHQPAAGNRRVLELVADQPRLLPAWVMLPDSCGELDPPKVFAQTARASGVVAVRAYPTDHGYDLDGADAAPVLDALADAELPLLVDAGQTTWPAIERIATARAGWPVIVGQIGYRSLRRVAGVMSRADNVYLDLSYLASHCGLEWLVERFGTSRVLFGTGQPVRDPAEAVTRLLWSELPDAALPEIGAANLRRLCLSTFPVELSEVSSVD